MADGEHVGDRAGELLPGVASSALGEVAVTQYLVVDVTGRPPDEIAALQAALHETWNVPSVQAPARIVPALGRIMAPAEIARESSLLSRDDFIGRYAPDRADTPGQRTASGVWNQLARHSYQWKRTLAGVTRTGRASIIDDPDVLAKGRIAERLFVGDVYSPATILDAEVLYELLRVTYEDEHETTLGISNVGPSKTRRLTQIVNDLFGLFDEAALPIR